MDELSLCTAGHCVKLLWLTCRNYVTPKPSTGTVLSRGVALHSHRIQSRAGQMGAATCHNCLSYTHPDRAGSPKLMLPGTALGLGGETLVLPLRWRTVVCPTAPYVPSSSLRSSDVSDTALMAYRYLRHIQIRPEVIQKAITCAMQSSPSPRATYLQKVVPSLA